jgi:hypothetical protein
VCIRFRKRNHSQFDIGINSLNSQSHLGENNENNNMLYLRSGVCASVCERKLRQPNGRDEDLAVVQAFAAEEH